MKLGKSAACAALPIRIGGVLGLGFLSRRQDFRFQRLALLVKLGLGFVAASRQFGQSRIGLFLFALFERPLRRQRIPGRRDLGFGFPALPGEAGFRFIASAFQFPQRLSRLFAALRILGALRLQRLLRGRDLPLRFGPLFRQFGLECGELALALAQKRIGRRDMILEFVKRGDFFLMIGSRRGQA